MSSTRTFDIFLMATAYYSGRIEATSSADAVEKASTLWRTANPNSFAQYDADLVDVVAAEVQP